MDRKIKTLLILLILTVKTQGQSDFRKGFIVTLENDTIQGRVDDRIDSENYRSCIFKGDEGEKEYFPNQIKGYGFLAKKRFTSEIVKGSFTEALIIGTISLYKANGKFLLAKGNDFFELEYLTVETNGIVRYEINTMWQGVVSYLIDDCLENSSDVLSKPILYERDLARIILKYNNCRRSLEFKSNSLKAKSKLGIGIAFGLSNTRIRTKERLSMFSYLDESYHSLDPSLGIIITASSPRVNENVAFQYEVHFIRSSFSSLVEIAGSPTEYHDTFINLTTLSFPVSAKCSFPQNKQGLYLQGGLNYDHHLNASTSLLSESVNQNVVNTSPERPAFEARSGQLGYWVGIGILKSYEKFKGSLTARFFQMSTLNKTEDMTLVNNRVSLNLILFK